MQRVLIALIALSIGLAACNRGADDTTTTTTTAPDQPVTRTTSAEPSGDSSDDGGEVQDDESGDDQQIEAAPSELPGYSIVRREGAEGGDRLVVLLEDHEYTDRILEELVFDITEVYAPVLEAYLIDDVAVADLVLVDEATLTDDDRAVLDDHLFVSLTQGTLVTFQGPFADMGEFRLGS